MVLPVQPSHPQLAVSAAIFRDGKVLLVRRSKSPARGLYSLPGGRVEFGETLHTALHREVDEETALKIEIAGHVNHPNLPPVSETSWEYKLSVARAKLVHDYLLENGIPQNRIIYKGYGNWEMRFPHARTEEQMALNRRVEIRILEGNCE